MPTVWLRPITVDNWKECQELVARPDCDEILLRYRHDNNGARQLYARLGFIEQPCSDGDVTAVLRIDTASPRHCPPTP